MCLCGYVRIYNSSNALDPVDMLCNKMSFRHYCVQTSCVLNLGVLHTAFTRRMGWNFFFGSLIYAAWCVSAARSHQSDEPYTLLPTGKRITPTATPGSRFGALNPGVADYPGFLAGQAISMVTSPDNKTLLILTSGYNRLNGADGERIVPASEEYVFVYDVSHTITRKTQVLRVPNAFVGITFSPDGCNLAFPGFNNTVCIMDVASRRIMAHRKKTAT